MREVWGSLVLLPVLTDFAVRQPKLVVVADALSGPPETPPPCGQ